MKNKNAKDKKNGLYDFEIETKVNKRAKDSEVKQKEKNVKINNKKKNHKTTTKDKKSKKINNKNENRTEIKKTSNQQSNLFNPNNEIIIGVTRVPGKQIEKQKIEAAKKQKKRNKKAKDKNERNNMAKAKRSSIIKKDAVYVEDTNLNKQSYNGSPKKTGIKGKQGYKNKKTIKLVLKWTTSVLIIMGIVIFAMLSPIFNIETIVVSGNDTVASDKIIGLSGIIKGENIFRLNSKEIINNIKKNGYIENIQINRKWPNSIEIKVEERQETYLIEYGSGYAYINNQGYILSLNGTKTDIPIVLGISTKAENIKEANRLDDNDLKKMSVVLKIMSVAQVNNIASLITTIDISDADNYKLYFASEQKTAYLGDCTNLETRMLFAISMIETERGKAGEIFVNMNLNTDKAFFRESV